jgi:hypothetical protein
MSTLAEHYGLTVLMFLSCISTLVICVCPRCNFMLWRLVIFSVYSVSSGNKTSRNTPSEKKRENADKHQLSEREKLGGLVIPIKYVWFLKVSSLYYTSNIFDLTIFCHSHWHWFHVLYICNCWCVPRYGFVSDHFVVFIWIVLFILILIFVNLVFHNIYYYAHIESVFVLCGRFSK